MDWGGQWNGKGGWGNQWGNWGNQWGHLLALICTIVARGGGAWRRSASEVLDILKFVL